ncbi:MAG: tyrosine-protein phosphatase [Gemmataceae bacterium]
MWAKVGNLVGVVLVAAGLAVPIAIACQQQGKLRNFHAVREGVLYRCGQPTPETISRLVRDLGIRTVITLRDDASSVDERERNYCLQKGLRFVRIPPMSWAGGQGKAPVRQGVRTFLDTVANPANHPILLHCLRGVHRTGLYTAHYRIEFEGWSVEDALEEMRALGYVEFGDHEDVRDYWAGYRRSGRYERVATTLDLRRPQSSR